MPDVNGPSPTLPTSGGGQQLGDGNTTSPILGVMKTSAIGSYTGNATVTTAELLSGLLSYTGAGHTLTLPTAALLDAAVPAAKVGSFIEFGVNATTGTATLAGGTGITTNATGAGSLAVAAAASARYRLVKTGTAAWNLYRVG